MFVNHTYLLRVAVPQLEDNGKSSKDSGVLDKNPDKNADKNPLVSME